MIDSHSFIRNWLCSYKSFPEPKFTRNPPSPLPPRCYTEVGLQEYIRIRGARVHNLKDISLSLPPNQLTVITGVSGSGNFLKDSATIDADAHPRHVALLF